MLVRVLYFGALKDIFHREGDNVSLPSGAMVSTLLDHYRALAPDHSRLWSILAVAVNQEFARSEQPLAENDEVALLPPVSGGSAPLVALVRDTIDASGLAETLRRDEDGAVVVFNGVVRNHSRGKRTLHLIYEAYEAMALDQMRKLAAEARERFAVRDVLLVHRLGKIAVGESSVVIVVASAHRNPAFDACRWLIDTLKSTVPIWKKEVFEDGAVWVVGEPFPQSVVSQPPSEPGE